ncbi:MAG TPA: fused MFS/spermidine synthase, partial [Candidatus Limnocylindrales bacterium]|nr:fused MFS/spermidine synthase [Candidatus Limnocylindrales bacterium]
ITIFTGAFLLFQVEPLLARYILPWFGGSSAVWITCMLFFQLLLVAGYAYSHLIATHLRARRQVFVHLTIVTACVLLMSALALIWQSPITPGPTWKPINPDFPITRIFVLLLVSIGLPFFILSTTGPLLQVWFARSHQTSSPYRLYALSNVGSLLALVTYPFVVEPALTLKAQAIVWSVLFVGFAIGVGLCARRISDIPSSSAADFDGADFARAPLSAPSTRILWIALATVPSVMLLATTNRICQQVAVMPFLWVLPLAIYLLSFIICFDNQRWYRRGVFHPALGAAVFAALIVMCSPDAGIMIQIATYSMLLFTICMVCHGELVRLKPHERYLTSFYLMVAIGGALGGVFVVAIAPMLFTGLWEFHLAIWASLLILFIVLMRDPSSWIHERRPIVAMTLLSGALVLPELIGATFSAGTINRTLPHLWPGFIAVGLMSAVAFQKHSRLATRWPGSILQACAILGLFVIGGVLIVDIEGNRANSLIATRNFYGALCVYSVDSYNPESHYYMLRHGQIIHGEQYSAADKRREPTTYYGRDSGIGLTMLNHPRRFARNPHDRALQVGAIGLGVGTIAAYGQPGDYIRFYEINPAVTKIADESGYFTYLRDSRARIEIVPGDARLSMERELANGNSQSFDVLVLDAFSGDAIPVHLLTLEAFEVYLGELNPDGVIAIHVTNRYLDLQPVIQEVANHFGLVSGGTHQSAGPLVKPSDWIMLARNNSVLGQAAFAASLKPLDSQRKVRLWTDDYSNLFQILK